MIILRFRVNYLYARSTARDHGLRAISSGLRPAAFKRIPKVAGALDPQSVELAALRYGQVVVDFLRVSSSEVAKACKILQNTYRTVNIALVNELIYCTTECG
jgi:UDP-N-acetyl-D-mannosaminuronate dehydrogenase